MHNNNTVSSTDYAQTANDESVTTYVMLRTLKYYHSLEYPQLLILSSRLYLGVLFVRCTLEYHLNVVYAEYAEPQEIHGYEYICIVLVDV
jgi:hypothetical protein